MLPGGRQPCSETDILASEAEDDAVRAPVWMTSFAEVEENGIRASVTSRRMSMFLTSSTARLASKHTIRALFLHILEGCSLHFYSEAETLRRPSGRLLRQRRVLELVTSHMHHNCGASHRGCLTHSLLYCCSVRVYGELTGRVSIVPVCTSQLVVRRYGLEFLPCLHQHVQLPNSWLSTRPGISHTVPVTVSPFVNFLSRTIPKMFPSVVLVLVRPSGLLRRCPGSCLRPVQVLVCSLPCVTPSAPCRRTWMAPGGSHGERRA